MNGKIMVIRAISATVARRALLFITIIGGLLFTLLLGATWALSVYVSPWWWLLLIILVPALIIAIALRLFAGFLTKRLYPQPLSKSQRDDLQEFVDKLQRLLETRGLGWPLFALLNLKDLLFYRELRTTKQLISDTTSLKRNLAQLEKSLQT